MTDHALTGPPSIAWRRRPFHAAVETGGTEPLGSATVGVGLELGLGLGDSLGLGFGLAALLCAAATIIPIRIAKTRLENVER